MTCADQVEVGMLGQCWVLLGAGCDELQWRLAGHTALDCPLRLSDRGSMKACVIIPLDAVNIALEAATLQSGGVGSAVIAPSMYGGTSAKMRPPDPTRTHAHLGAGLICRQLADWEEVGTGHRACNALSGRRYAQVPVGAFESERARKHESSVLGGIWALRATQHLRITSSSCATSGPRRNRCSYMLIAGCTNPFACDCRSKWPFTRRALMWLMPVCTSSGYASALWQMQDCQAIWLKDSRLRNAEGFCRFVWFPAHSSSTSARHVTGSALYTQLVKGDFLCFKTLLECLELRPQLASVHQPITYSDFP